MGLLKTNKIIGFLQALHSSDCNYAQCVLYLGEFTSSDPPKGMTYCCKNIKL